MNMLKELRGDVTQSEMASLFGVNQNTWSSWETGRTKPKYEVMMAMERYFNLRKEEIFFTAFNYKNELMIGDLLQKEGESMTLVQMFEANFTLIENISNIMNFKTKKAEAWQYWFGFNTREITRMNSEEIREILVLYINKDLSNDIEREFEFIITFKHNEFYLNVYQNVYKALID